MCDFVLCADDSWVKIGLAMQELEAQDSIVATLGGDSALDETRRGCTNWDNYNDAHPVVQTESGV